MIQGTAEERAQNCSHGSMSPVNSPDHDWLVEVWLGLDVGREFTFWTLPSPLAGQPQNTTVSRFVLTGAIDCYCLHVSDNNVFYPVSQAKDGVLGSLLFFGSPRGTGAGWLRIRISLSICLRLGKGKK